MFFGDGAVVAPPWRQSQLLGPSLPVVEKDFFRWRYLVTSVSVVFAKVIFVVTPGGDADVSVPLSQFLLKMTWQH